MPRHKLLHGPIGNGWVEEIRTADGIKFVARWQYYVPDPSSVDGRRRENGYHELGLKVHHGSGDDLTSKSKAEKKWVSIRDSVMGKTTVLPAALKAERTFRWFAEEDPDGFRKRREQRWSGTTPAWFTYIAKKLYDRFGDVPMKDLREQDLQAFLNKLADDDYSESVVQNSLIYLRAILEEAFQVGILLVNPAARLMKPRHTRKPQRPWLPVEKYQEILGGTPNHRDRLMMKLLYLGGLRRGELFGLQWHDFEPDKSSLNIERQILENGTIGPAKTDGSIAPVSIAAEIMNDLVEWRKYCPTPDAGGWIFSTERGAPMNSGFWRKKVLTPAGNKVGITKLNYHMFRRGLATEAHQAGITDKSIQGQMRHSRVSTTMNVYAQTIPTAQKEAFEEFSKVVNIKSQRTA